MDDEIDRKVDVTTIQFLLVQDRQQTHGLNLIGSGANGLSAVVIQTLSWMYHLKLYGHNQEIRIKGREMALVWHEKVSSTALQTSTLLHTYTLLVRTHNMTTVKEIPEQCCQL